MIYLIYQITFIFLTQIYYNMNYITSSSISSQDRVLCSWFHTPTFGVRNSILNWVSKTHSLKRKKGKSYLKFHKAFLICNNLLKIYFMFLIASKSMKTLFSYLCGFVMSYDACNVLIICRLTLWQMKVAMLDCYECKNLI